jgi:XTP/dITP diphosphohydrolase
MKLLFVSRNAHKHAETARVLEPSGIAVEASHLAIEELQTVDTESLVRDKATRAFKELGRPLFVEHSGLCLDALNGFPGGLTQIFWDTLKKDRFAELFANEADKVMAVSHIGYVDGRRVHIFRGEIEGRIVYPPRIDHGFQWDCVFKPVGHDQTFSEMGDKKNDISMRSIALMKLRDHLEKVSP